MKKSSNKNIDQKIKSKIENHEFEFSDHAWNKMEGILDPPTSSRKYYFLMSLIFFTMMLFLVLYYLLSGTTANPIPPPPLSDAMKSNTSVIDTTSDTPIMEEVLVKETLLKETIAYDSSGLPNLPTPGNYNDYPLQGITPKIVTGPKSELATPVDSAVVQNEVQTPEDAPTTVFVQSLKNTLAEHEAHFATEKVYLQLDRPFFEPGEQIWFNAFVRDANSLKPSRKSDMLYVELLGPNGNKIKTHKILAPNGTGRGNFKLGKNAVGGRYTIKAYTNWQKNQDLFFEQKIQVQKPVLPILKMTLDLTRKAYGPGDEVSADIELKALDDQPLSKKTFEYVLELDGKKTKTFKAKTDKKGKANIKFSLPDNLETTDGLVNVLIEHLGQRESIARSVPIILNKIDLQFLPEGGYLLNEMENGLAFKALNEFGKPADVTGIIVDQKGNEVAEFSTYHQGMGAMNFKPKNNQQYVARIIQPEGIDQEYALPAAAKKGYGLRVLKNTDDQLTVAIHSTEAEAMILVLQSRGEIHGYVTTNAVAGTQEVKLSTKDTKIGIAQLTLFDEQEIPRAERMVFLHPDKKLSIDITADKPAYQPRDAVNLKIAVRDDRGIPLSGKFSLAVADDNLLSFADDKQGNILGSVLLNSELKGTVEEPNFYFDPAEDHPEKDQVLALDHLMLTQGWRRFDWNAARDQGLAAMEFANEEAVIGGMVINQYHEPVPNAEVQLTLKRQSVLTDENGNFRFLNVDPVNPGLKLIVTKNGARKELYLKKFQDDIKMEIFEQKTVEIATIRTPSKKTQISGIVKDGDQGDGMYGANIIFSKNGSFITGASSVIDGKFKATLDPGRYDVVVNYVGCIDFTGSVLITEGYDHNVSIPLYDGRNNLQEITVVEYKVPLISKDNTTSGMVATVDQVKTLPTKNIDAIAATAAGLSRADEGDNVVIRGSRADATDVFIDGIRVRGSLIPAQNEEAVPPPPPPPPPPPAVVEAIGKPKEKKRGNAARKPVPGSNWANQNQTVIAYRRWGFHQPAEFYAPAYEQKEQAIPSNQRTDFRKTLYWNPAVETGMDGTANVRFYTSDALTSFRATLEGFGQDGGIGRGTKIFSNEIPLGMNVKVPARVLMGDELKIPVIFDNKTNQSVTGKLVVELPEELKLMDGFNNEVKLLPNQGNTIFIPVQALSPHPGTSLKVIFAGGGFKDNITEKIEILPRGFPVEKGFTSQELSQTFTLDINDPVEGSVQLSLNAQTSMDQQLQADLKRMVRQPRGCFEQTSSSNYPNLLILEFLKSTENLDAKTEEKLTKALQSGYKRLTGYEVPGGGFDWFGKPPGHEALTAYGLLQFTDMKRVFPVDQKMIDRNAKWLLDRRNGEGGWLLSKRGLHSWKTNDPVYDAYIVWALAEAGMGKKIKKEIEKSAKDALSSEDPYLLGLLANTFYRLKDKRAKEFLDLLLKKQEANGKWSKVANTVVNSRGISKEIETTALAALAMMQDQYSHPELLTAMDFIKNGKTQYGYGSTQATVLAMKALVAYAQKSGDKSETGRLKISINGKKVSAQEYSRTTGSIELTNLGQYLKKGKNRVKVSFSETERALPYYLGLRYHTLLPTSDDDCALELSTKLESKKAKMGDQQRLAVNLKNKTTEAVTNPIIKLGIPAGLSVQAWQLKEMEEQGVFDYYELFDGYLVFYFRELGPSATKKINLDLKADIPGQYSAAASSAWLYYANEEVSWSKPEAIRVER